MEDAVGIQARTTIRTAICTSKRASYQYHCPRFCYTLADFGDFNLDHKAVPWIGARIKIIRRVLSADGGGAGFVADHAAAEACGAKQREEEIHRAASPKSNALERVVP